MISFSAARAQLVLAAAVLALAPPQAFGERSAKPPRIGYLVTGGAVSFPISVEPFKRGMRDLGYSEGKDYVLEIRSAEGRTERLPSLAAELVKMNVNVIVASSTPGGQAAMRATGKTPIVIANSSDPLGAGLVKSLSRPGGNITGLSNIASDLGEKQLEILLTLMPTLARIAVLTNPDNHSHRALTASVMTGAKKRAIRVLGVAARNAGEIQSAFAALARERSEAVIVALEPVFIEQRRELAELALKYKVPTMFAGSGHAEAGGLMSYGPDISDNFRRAAWYVDRILKGVAPGDLPVEQPTKFEFIVNLRTAAALGLAVPQELRFRADKVIQ